MLVEMAVADAYAIPWEFTDEQKAPNDLSGFHPHPTYHELKAGQYTDDTQRSIANALVLTSGAEDKFNAIRYAQAYIEQVHMDPREGYSRGYQAFLASVNSPYDFLVKIERTKGSNGSLMGVAPMGFLSDLREVKLAAATQALVTHHPDTVAHAQLVAMAAHYFLHVQDCPRDSLFDWLMLNTPFYRKGDGETFHNNAIAYERSPQLKTGIKASSISSYMIYAVSTFDTLTEIMKDAVNRGGDTDSAAAVSVAVASCCPEIVNDIPDHLTQTMDEANPNFGVEYMERLENRLRLMYKII